MAKKKTDSSNIKNVSDRHINEMIEINRKVHATWHEFEAFLEQEFAADIAVKQTIDIGYKKIEYMHCDDLALANRLVGFEVQEKIIAYAELHKEDVKVVRCEDSVYASSIIVLVAHPKMGITTLFVPHCTKVQNQFFLYGSHYEQLMKAYKELKWVYEETTD